MVLFLDGAITLGFLGVALFFLKLWRTSQEGLLAAFALSALLLGINQLLLAISPDPEQENAWLYLPRLAAFIVIAGAILRKNLEPRRD
jgi:uncharacterized membrane protein HdeD (DUF308 family)